MVLTNAEIAATENYCLASMVLSKKRDILLDSYKEIYVSSSKVLSLEKFERNREEQIDRIVQIHYKIEKKEYSNYLMMGIMSDNNQT
jgi:hypothetical protein